jgi:hypothetical protein
MLVVCIIRALFLIDCGRVSLASFNCVTVIHCTLTMMLPCTVTIGVMLRLLLLSTLGGLGSSPQSHGPWSASHACPGTAHTSVAIILSSTTQLLAMASVAGSMRETQVVNKHVHSAFGYQRTAALEVVHRRRTEKENKEAQTLSHRAIEGPWCLTTRFV